MSAVAWLTSHRLNPSKAPVTTSVSYVTTAQKQSYPAVPHLKSRMSLSAMAPTPRGMRAWRGFR